MARLFISAAHKSSGKTTLSIGLCAAWHYQGVAVQAFKKGPDYIDPLWLSAASARPCHNLDFNTMSHPEILQTVAHYSQSAELALIEANKGLYDGVSLQGEDSNAALAKLTQSPVVLVLDTRGMTRGIVPLLVGYLAFDREVNIAGVIFNRVGGARHANKLRQAVEYFTEVPVLGSVQNSQAMSIDERHLGLIPSNESHEAATQIERIRQQVAEQVDLTALMALAKTAPVLDRDPSPLKKLQAPANPAKILPKVRIGLCQDAAFGFYYAGDLEALQQAGAELISINTLQDQALPAELDGLIIGGGFPETHLETLAANTALKAAIHQAIEAGLPTYAECGGLMYLSRSIVWQGQQAAMVGIIQGDAVMHAKPQGRGYVRLQELPDMLWPPVAQAQSTDAAFAPPSAQSSPPTIRAHEFHYSRLENLSVSGRFAYRVLRGEGIDGQHDGLIYKNLLASYTHMRHTAQYAWATRFVDFVRSKKRIGTA